MTKKTIVSIILVLLIAFGLCLLSGCDSASDSKTGISSTHIVLEEVSGERYESIYVQIKYWSQWAKVESYKIYDNDIVEIILDPNQASSYITTYGTIIVTNLDTVAFWHKEKNQSNAS
mgnify:CR=1 FL=1